MNEKRAYNAWVSRENKLLLQEKHAIEETVRTVKENIDDYDTIDVIIDLLAATIVSDVAEYLENEYRKAYSEGIDGLTDSEPSEEDVSTAVNAEVAGLEFSERIRDYVTTMYATVMLEPERIDEAFKTLNTSLTSLVVTDGNRVRGAARLNAGQDLQSVGFDTTKTWLSMDDEKVRDTHTLLHGTTIGIDEYFYTVNGKALAPSQFGVAEEDCNCRCILSIRTK